MAMKSYFISTNCNGANIQEKVTIAAGLWINKCEQADGTNTVDTWDTPDTPDIHPFK